jgi:ATP-dependent helicase HrpA
LAAQSGAACLKTAASPALPPDREITEDDLDAFPRRLVLPGPDGRAAGLAFASLHPDPGRQTVTLRYIDDESQARRLNRSGVHALYARHFTRELTALRKLCKDAVTSHSASWLSLGRTGPAAELRADLETFLLDHIFTAATDELPTSAQFRDTVQHVHEQGLLRTASGLLASITGILRQRRAVSDAIAAWAGRAQANKSYQEKRRNEYNTALEQIVPSDFLRIGRADTLRHKLRYLQGLRLRIERAEHAPGKDEKKAERLHGPESRLALMARFSNPTTACLACQEEYRELLEEFRISLFAPELGTAQPVSEQRLLRKWQELEDVCRQME